MSDDRYRLGKQHGVEIVAKELGELAQYHFMNKNDELATEFRKQHIKFCAWAEEVRLGNRA